MKVNLYNVENVYKYYDSNKYDGEKSCPFLLIFICNKAAKENINVGYYTNHKFIEIHHSIDGSRNIGV